MWQLNNVNFLYFGSSIGDLWSYFMWMCEDLLVLKTILFSVTASSL